MKGLIITIITIGTAAATGFVAFCLGVIGGYWSAADELDHDVVLDKSSGLCAKPREGVRIIHDETVEED